MSKTGNQSNQVYRRFRVQLTPIERNVPLHRAVLLVSHTLVPLKVPVVPF